MLWIPHRNHRRRAVEYAASLNHEVGAEKLHAHGTPKQHTSHKSVYPQKHIISLRTEHVRRFGAEFIAYGLQDETEQYEHPQPVCAAETRGIIKGKRCEKRAAKHHQSGECQFPFTAEGVHHHSFALFLARAHNHCLSALHEEEEHKEAAKECDDEPPVYL